jgi:hypothetical protein
MYQQTIDYFAELAATKAQAQRRNPIGFLIASAMAGAYHRGPDRAFDRLVSRQRKQDLRAGSHAAGGHRALGLAAGGAYLYVCGDALRMAKDVETAMAEIAAKEGCMSGDAAKAFASQLKASGRYQADVY